MMLDLLLACATSPIDANIHKLVIGGVGVSLLTAAFFVRQHREAQGRRGHAFEVLIDRDTKAPTDATGAGERK